MNPLRQATAAQSRAIGAFVDDGDFKTLEIALSIANTDIKLIKNGAASVNKNSGGATHRANGTYGITFDATDTDTVGELEVSIFVAGALVGWKTFFVVEEAVYDALFAAAAPGYVANAPVNVAQFGGSNGTFSGGRPEVNTSHVGGTIQTARDIGASVLLSSGAGTGQVKLAAGYVAPNWGDVGNPTTTVGLSGTTVKTATDVETDTADIQSRLPVALSGGRMDSHIGSIADSVLTAAKFAVGAFDAVWSVAARLLTAGTNIVLAKGTGITGFNDLSAAQVNTEVDTALADYDGPTQADLDAAESNIRGADNDTLKTLSDQIDGISGGGGLTAQQVRDAMKLAPSVGVPAAGSIDLHLDEIQAKTDLIPSDPADASDIATSFGTVHTTLGTIAGYLDTEIAAIKAKTDNLPASPAAVGSAMTLTSGERDSIADAYLDRANGVETGLTPRQAMRLGAAADAGEVEDAATPTIKIRKYSNGAASRIEADVDDDGNRSNVVVDLT